MNNQDREYILEDINPRENISAYVFQEQVTPPTQNVFVKRRFAGRRKGKLDIVFTENSIIFKTLMEMGRVPEKYDDYVLRKQLECGKCAQN